MRFLRRDKSELYTSKRNAILSLSNGSDAFWMLIPVAVAVPTWAPIWNANDVQIVQRGTFVTTCVFFGSCLWPFDLFHLICVTPSCTTRKDVPGKSYLRALVKAELMNIKQLLRHGHKLTKLRSLQFEQFFRGPAFSLVRALIWNNLYSFNCSLISVGQNEFPPRTAEHLNVHLFLCSVVWSSH